MKVIQGDIDWSQEDQTITFFFSGDADRDWRPGQVLHLKKFYLIELSCVSSPSFIFFLYYDSCTFSMLLPETNRE